MAEVLVSTQTITNIMLHSPPEPFHTTSSNQSHHNSSRGSAPRSYSNHNAGIPYRGTSSTPVQAYAFQSTPNLRQDTRSTSNPTQRQSVGPTSLAATRNAYSPTSSTSNASSNSASNTSSVGAPSYTVSKDDSVLIGGRGSRPTSTFLTSTSTPDLSLVSFDTTPKPSPDRYRRVQRRVDSSSSNVSNSQQILDSQTSTPSIGGNQSSLQQGGQNVGPFRGSVVPMHARTASSDDVHVKQGGRYRRRSLSSMEASSGLVPQVTTIAPTWSQVAARGHAGQIVVPVVPANAPRPISYHQRHDSNESKSSGSSASAQRPSSARHDTSQKANGTSTQRPKTAPSQSGRTSSRTTSSDASKRLTLPSPLSQPMGSETDTKAPKLATARPATSAGTSHAASSSPSPAVQQLHALSERDPNKGMKSRLRRAFSFGSAQELRKASAENAGRAKLQKERHEESRSDENGLEGEDAAIAAKQEAGGIGAGIYSGQGVVYGSTDNLSISSTASSASMMLRKMGRGAKKSARSIKGLFRPKSVIGDPAADSAVSQPTVASTEVSLVTVEAEREKVNVNADPRDQPGGGTGFPHLERNSLDTASAAGSERPTSSRHGQNDSVSSRKSIVGGDRERMEVLAAVKKGILKRSNTASPVGSRQESTSDVPSIPGTPDEQRLTDNMERDYFIATARFTNLSTRSLPDRPGHASIRSISWNPKVSFHDVFSPNEYDRRGDIATCNRLTPVLAQQIKEELNSFKMEMEVHEESKPHTHFF